MKKIFWMLLCALLICTLAFTACGKEKAPADDSSAQNPTEDNTTEKPDDTPADPACEHEIVTDAAIEPTCTEAGKSEGSHCQKCGEVLTAQTEIATKGHTEVTDKAVAATCTKEGKTEGKHCSVCNTILVKQDTVAKAKHIKGEWVAQKRDSCLVEGTKNKSCTKCNLVLETETIPAGHTLTQTVYAPSPFGSQGYTQHKCSECNHAYKDNYTDFDFTKATDTLQYQSNNNGTCSVIGITDPNTKYILIPSVSPDGETVTAIRGGAFQKMKTIEYVQIPDTVTQIGDSAFQSCSKLKKVVFPQNTVTFGRYVFSECTALKEADLSQTKTEIVTHSLFNGCSALQWVKLCNVAEIEQFAFDNCTSLTSVLYTDSLIEIGEKAFRNCKKLTECRSVNSMHNLDTIQVFMNESFYASGLQNIVFSKDLKAINYGAFHGCQNLKTLDLSQTSVTTLGNWLGAKFETLIFPESITTIPYRAFAGAQFQEMILPDSVTTIAQHAFENAKFKKITFGSSLTKIGFNAFSGASGDYDFHKVHLDLTIEYGAFANNTFTAFAFPDSTVSIGDGVLEGCNKLVTLTIPFISTSPKSTSYSTDCFGSLFGYEIDVWDQDEHIPKSLKTIILHGTENPTARDFMYIHVNNFIIGKGITKINAEAFDESTIQNVLYEGTEEEFNKIEIGSRNNAIVNANIYFYSETPSAESGSCWYYANGIPVIHK